MNRPDANRSHRWLRNGLGLVLGIALLGAAPAVSAEPRPSTPPADPSGPPTDLSSVELMPIGLPFTNTPLAVSFSTPIVPAPDTTVWFVVTQVEGDVGSPVSSVQVTAGASSVAIPMPAKAGDYEVHMVVYDQAGAIVKTPFERGLKVAEAPPPTELSKVDVTLASEVVAKGEPVTLKFSGPLHAAPGEKFWMTVCPPDTDEDSWSAWTYVDAGATEVEVVPSDTGKLEVRLHANYPTKSHNVVFRAPVEVVDK